MRFQTQFSHAARDDVSMCVESNALREYPKILLIREQRMALFLYNVELHTLYRSFSTEFSSRNQVLGVQEKDYLSHFSLQ